MGKIIGNQAIHDFRNWNMDDWASTASYSPIIGAFPIAGEVYAAKDRVQAGTRREEQQAPMRTTSALLTPLCWPSKAGRLPCRGHATNIKRASTK